MTHELPNQAIGLKLAITQRRIIDDAHKLPGQAIELKLVTIQRRITDEKLTGCGTKPSASS